MPTFFRRSVRCVNGACGTVRVVTYGGGNADSGYTLRGGRMLTTDNYECTWDLFKSIPSLENPGRTVYDETIAFNEVNVSNSKARLVDRNRFKVDVGSMGFSMMDRIELVRLSHPLHARR
jgi:oleate hydratase